MAQEVMFPPQSNSPVTELAAEITSSDNVVIVVAGNLLPAAPNVVTLGLDELAETIYYATKNGNELSGVVRGYDGTSAKGWSTGTRVARYLTAQDISALQHNISDHETRINGITSETINKVTPKLVDDLPALYPIGLSVFSLSLAASAPWKTAIGYPGSGHSTLVQTSKANDSQYSIIQRVTFSGDLGVEAMYERSSTANNSWNGAWIKVVSRGEFDQFKNEVDAHLADYIRQPGFAATSGTSTAYTVTLDPAPASLADGFGITVVPHVDCGDEPTLNVNGLGAVSLKDQKGVAIAAGKMTTGKPYTFRKVGTDFLADSGSEGGGGSSLHDWNAYTTHQNWAGTSTTIPATSFATMLDVTGEGHLVFVRADTASGGSARNPDIRMTVDGTAYTFEGVDAGANRQGNMLLEPIYFKSSLKIEVFNRSASAGSFWLDYTYLLKTGTPGESQTLLTSSARKMAYSEVFAATDSDVVNITGSGYLLGIDFSAYYNSGVANLLGTIILDGTPVMNARILFSASTNSTKESTFKGPLRFNSNLTVRHRMSASNVSTAVTRVWYILD